MMTFADGETSREQAPSPPRFLENFGIVVLGVIGFLLVGYFIVLRTPTTTQFWLGVVIILAIGMTARRFPQYRLAVYIVSGAVSGRYLYWRLTQTLNFDHPANAFVSLLLFAAEFYAVLILFLGFFQTVESIERNPVPLPEDTNLWPTVDVFVPSYNEGVEVLLPTLLGAKAIDYPKKNVFLLDDGRREEMQKLCERIGVGYIIRDDNKHAKAGNINAAIKNTTGELIAIFDADHIPTRAFLQLTTGFFLKNANLALVQTPHHFFNPDPFERNLHIYGEVPSEQDLFYHQIQPSSDFWNATFFCGSCAVIRREALLAVGGIAVETVTEDCHTALRLQSKGWDSHYLNIPLAAGLATERYSAHITQRIRWARGMIQILRLDFPLAKKGLSWAQGFCYFNSMIHFLFGIPRIIYMIAPAFYLLLDLNTIIASAFDVVSYGAPHIFVAIVATSITSRSLRHSFWAEVYETAIAFYTSIATTLALIRPTLGKFVVTAKGVQGSDAYYDWKSARPVLVLLALNIVCLLAVPINYVWKAGEESSILINAVWSLYNVIILSACAFVAYEQPEVRTAYRHKRRLPALIAPDSASEEEFWSETRDLSIDGVLAIAPHGQPIPEEGRLRLFYEFGDPFDIEFQRRWSQEGQDGVEFGLEFRGRDFEQSCELYRIIFGSASNWINAHYEEDRPLQSFGRVLVTPWRAWRAVREKKRALKQARTHQQRASASGNGSVDRTSEVTDEKVDKVGTQSLPPI